MYKYFFRTCTQTEVTIQKNGFNKKVYFRACLVFLSFEQKLIHLHSVYWLTDLFVRIMLLQTWQRWKKHTLAKLLQGFRQQVTWPTLLAGNIDPEKSLEEYLVDNNKLKTINLFTLISVRTWWESPTRWEKKIRTRSLARELIELEWRPGSTILY